MTPLKQCPVCKISKELVEFPTNISKYNLCKACKNEKSKQWQKNNPDKVKEQRRKTRLKKDFGLSVEEYDNMFKLQKGCCAVCNETQETKRLAVDHCHITGKIRQLLCTRCNILLGKTYDSENLLLKLASYLRKHKETT